MAHRFDLPSVADLLALGDRHERAITVYAQTDPDDREKSLLTAKSAIDSALRTVRDSGASHGAEQALRDRWAAIETSDLWQRLSSSIAIFLADDTEEVFVLPNRLENQVQVGTRFDIGQLVRAVTTPQKAFALTLSQDGWNLWQATASARATELTVDPEHPGDLAEATNRATVRDRGHVRRLVGDEGRKVLLEKYARRVAEAVEAELGSDSADVPLFVFATPPLLDLYLEADQKRLLVPVSGAPDQLKPHEIDAAIRAGLPQLNADRINARLNEIADGAGAGRVVSDLVDIARATTIGAVETLVYDFTVDINGELDSSTGEIRYDDDGYDLLSRIAAEVLKQGGTAIAARDAEIIVDIWTPPAVAGLRYPLT